ncbi:hypothetical protein EGJ22_19940 [Pseudomonas sp. p99-361]|nr:hypothetical protein F1602_06425 [Pseudomonas putida]RRV11280.1 hypothetical protein EGJ22_19940 [Pseudomonas sp. p99-361]
MRSSTAGTGGAGPPLHPRTAVDLALILILIFATSGGRAEGMRREVTGMDARQALRPQGRGLQRVLPGACP